MLLWEWKGGTYHAIGLQFLKSIHHLHGSHINGAQHDAMLRARFDVHL